MHPKRLPWQQKRMNTFLRTRRFYNLISFNGWRIRILREGEGDSSKKNWRRQDCGANSRSEVRFQKVPRRKERLSQMVRCKKNVAPGFSIIHTDKWKAYSTLDQHGYDL